MCKIYVNWTPKFPRAFGARFYYNNYTTLSQCNIYSDTAPGDIELWACRKIQIYNGHVMNGARIANLNQGVRNSPLRNIWNDVGATGRKLRAAGEKF